MSFLRLVLATLVGLILFTFLAFMLMLGTIGALSSGESPTVNANSVLYLNMSGPVDERVADDPFQEIFAQSAPMPIGLLDLLASIRAAATDDRIKGIYMENGFIGAGNASLQEIRDALVEFKESGKFIVSYGEYLSEADYYLASVADELYLNPEGFLEFNGYSANISFFKGTFEKLGIEPQIFRVGEFKSAVEPFMLKKMSDENRAQISSFINDMHAVYLDNVAQSRGIDRARLEEISNEMLVRLPEDAETLGLVTKLAYRDEVRAALRRQMGKDEDAKVKSIGFRDYKKAIDMENDEVSENRVAVITATGEIVAGNGQPENIGGDKFAREIRKARENKKVKAIVLRINSPGGSLTGSDVIWREIMLTKGVKPIIASMSDVAASGGYYIAMPCDTIVAQPNTITGSIGIFGMLFNFEHFLEDKLGITNDVVKTGKYSDIFTVTRELTPFEKEIIQNSVNKGYDTFTSKAASGRGMTVDQLKKYASGRVWTGRQAFENGLVDVLGSFDDAVALAAASAGISDDYRVSYYPPKENMIDQLFKKGKTELDAYAQARSFGLLAPYVKELKSLENMKGIQARMPYDIKIH